MPIELIFNSEPKKHNRTSIITRNDCNEIEYSIAIDGVWNYKPLEHRTKSKGLTNVQSTIQFISSGRKFEESILWIEKYKPEYLKDYIQEVGVAIFISENELNYINQLTHTQLEMQVVLDIDIAYNEKEEINFQLTLDEFNSKNKKIKKEYKVNSYKLTTPPFL
jgi:hypothetical protein